MISLEDDASEQATTKVTYRSFLVRGWRVSGAGGADRPLWRFVVQEVGSRQPRRAFAGLDQLVSYLHAELDGEQPADREAPGGE